MTPAEIPLTLSKDILRLPISMNARAVLAEIVSLHAANEGCCDASDAHFAARLTINKDTVSVAVQQLETLGLVVKVTTLTPGGKYRTLSPDSAAIAAKAATNPYPEYAPTPNRKFRSGQAGNSGQAKPEIPVMQAGISGYPKPEKPESLTGISGGNIPLNTTITFHLPDEAASAAPAEKSEVVAQVEKPSRKASHTEGGAPDVDTSITAKRLLMRNSPVATLAAFEQAWQAAAQAHPETYTPYAQADLAHYHGALLGWSNAEKKTKYDWVSTILGSMRRDNENGRLRTVGTSAAGQDGSQVGERLNVIDSTLAARRARRAAQQQ